MISSTAFLPAANAQPSTAPDTVSAPEPRTRLQRLGCAVRGRHGVTTTVRTFHCRTQCIDCGRVWDGHWDGMGMDWRRTRGA